jgi:hypothetical protein
LDFVALRCTPTAALTSHSVQMVCSPLARPTSRSIDRSIVAKIDLLFSSDSNATQDPPTHPTHHTHPTHQQRAGQPAMEAVEADIVAAVGGGELTVDRVRAEVRALSEGIAAKQVRPLL